MTMVVTRQQAADQLRIDDAAPEGNDLDLKIEAASAAALDYIERDASDYEVSGGSGTYSFPYQLQQAVLAFVGDMYRYRDSGDFQYKQGGAQLPQTVRAILYPLKTFGIDDD